MKWLIAAAALFATPAFAQDDPRFCPSRPSLGESGCTTLPGQFQVEVSAFDWQRDDNAVTREDTVLAGDLLVRAGIGPSTELQFAWTPFGHVRTRDKLTGSIDSVRRGGDIRIGIRQNLHNPDGKGLSYAVEPFVMVPVGRMPVGAGDWGAGVVVPVGYDITDRLNFNFTGEVDAMVDEDGDGRHGAYSAIVGLGYALTEKLTAVAELSVARDDDPMDPHTESVVAGSLAWQPGKRYQVDVLATAGLNHSTPDFRLVTGGAILF